MATLWKRANLAQTHMLRAVAGAVRNTAEAHGATLPFNFDRSVAKRAVGTLSALQLPKALAVSLSRHEDQVRTERSPDPRGSQALKGSRKGGRQRKDWRSPLFCIQYEISRKMWSVTDPAAREAYIDVLRMLDRERKNLDE